MNARDDDTLTGRVTRRLACDWKPFRDGIYVGDLVQQGEGAAHFTQLFARGILYSPETFSKRRWEHPEDGVDLRAAVMEAANLKTRFDWKGHDARRLRK